MLGLFKRKPKIQDETLSEMAQMFISLPDDPTPFSELLDVDQLDFSIESLVHVDDYLDKVRQQELENDVYGKIVLRCGAYVGEVVRHNSAVTTFHWVDYKGALSINKSIAEFGECFGSAAILWDGAAGLNFPLAKVEKFINNGREDSVKSFAQVMINLNEND